MNFSFIDLLNSARRNPKCKDELCDMLDDADWVRSFLERWELGCAKAAPQDLKEMRAVMQRIIDDTTQDKRPSGDDIIRLGHAVNGSDMRYELVPEPEGYRLKAVPVEENWSWVLQSIALPFAELLSTEDIKRLKKCDNACCQWVFYDETKNNTRRWCSSTCGSLIKVRECRKRKKECQPEDEKAHGCGADNNEE